MNVVNPVRGWLLECVMPGSCANLQMNINFMPNSNFDRIDGFVFSAPNAAQGAVIKINAMSQIEVEQIRCEEYGSCNGLTIEAGMAVDLSSLNVECSTPGACFGCTIR
eukprot:UN00326